MNKEPLVSVIMPTYNCGKYIGESIQSVINQTYKNWELIIVDDNSTDNTKQIIDNYSNKKIKYFRNSINEGVAKARNRGIELANGDYIAFLDSDDLWDKTKLIKQIELIECGYKFTFTGSAFINEIGEKYKYELKVPKRVDKKELLKQNIISCSSTVIEKGLLYNHKFPISSKNIHEDYALWLSILEDVEYAYAVNESLLLYRIREKSKSSSKVYAAIMNWNVLKMCNISFMRRIIYMGNYCFNGIKKYKKIKLQ